MKTQSLINRVQKIEKKKEPAEHFKHRIVFFDKDGNIVSELVDGQTIDKTPPYRNIHDKDCPTQKST